MLDLLARFVSELRRAGLAVSPTEHIDAARALSTVGLTDRERLRAALAATLVKRQEHRTVFNTLFDVWFAVRRHSSNPDVTDHLTPADLARMLDAALESGDADELRNVARLAVARLGGMDPTRPTAASYPVLLTMRGLDVDGALRRLLAAAGGGGAGSDQEAGITGVVRRDEYQRRARTVRVEVEAEVRRRMVEARGAAEVAKALRRPLPEDVDLLHASSDDIAALRRALAPLARRMATRLARDRRHHRRGRIDVRSTVRHSLSYGGVFAEPRFRRRHPAKPEILVLADVSGSVAAFARFTLEFVYAVSGAFSAVRAFVFLDGVDEVTRIFDTSRSLDEALRRVDREADVVWADGHSDYGHALVAFWDRWGGEVTGKTSVVVLGDARNNYHGAESWVLDELGRRARKVYWLNPEPRSYWNTGDSIAAEYAPHCDAMAECRTLRQLEHFIASVA